MRWLEPCARRCPSQPHVALDGVALAERNSHQINLCLPRLGRASHGYPERYLSKECVGSNRALTRTIATSRRDDDRDESPIQTDRRGPSSGSTTERAALPYDSPSPYALTGRAKSVRRRRDDSRARARWCQHEQTPPQSDGTRKQATTQSIPVCKETDGNRFRLTNSYRNGHIALVHEAPSGHRRWCGHNDDAIPPGGGEGCCCPPGCFGVGHLCSCG